MNKHRKWTLIILWFCTGNSETYPGPYETSKMKCSVKIVNSFQPLSIFLKLSILDVCQRSEYASALFPRFPCCHVPYKTFLNLECYTRRKFRLLFDVMNSNKALHVELLETKIFSWCEFIVISNLGFKSLEYESKKILMFQTK